MTSATCLPHCAEYPTCGHRFAALIDRVTGAEVPIPDGAVIVPLEPEGIRSARQHALISKATVRAEKAEAEVAEFAAKDYAPMSRIRRAERVAENAALDKRAAEAELARVNAGRALEQAALSRALPIVTAADAALAALTGEGSASFRARRALTILGDIHEGRA